MKVIHTIDLVIKINCKRNTVQAVVADTATKAAGVIGLADSLQYALHDEVAADLTLFRGLLEA